MLVLCGAIGRESGMMRRTGKNEEEEIVQNIGNG
jgi:hypothetical protein